MIFLISEGMLKGKEAKGKLHHRGAKLPPLTYLPDLLNDVSGFAHGEFRCKEALETW
ncbi:hypothetical protein D3C87_2095410 [compost metagenome]